MLYSEIIAVCSEIHTKHGNTLCGQNVELFNVTLAVHIVTTEPYTVNTYRIIFPPTKRSLICKTFLLFQASAAVSIRPSLPERRTFQGISSTVLQSGKDCDRVDDVARVTAFDYSDIMSGYGASNIKATGINELLRVLKAVAMR